MLDMFFPHVKAEASASPELPFPLYSFGSMTYDDPDPVAFLPPASRTVRRRSSKGLLWLCSLLFCSRDSSFFLTACDQCRKSKCKCERSAASDRCKNCAMLNTCAYVLTLCLAGLSHSLLLLLLTQPAPSSDPLGSVDHPRVTLMPSRPAFTRQRPSWASCSPPTIPVPSPCFETWHVTR